MPSDVTDASCTCAARENSSHQRELGEDGCDGGDGDRPRGTLVVGDDAPQLMTRAQILALLGISRSTLHRYMRRHGFPRPVGPPRCRQLWRREAVVDWMRQHYPYAAKPAGIAS